MGFFGNPMSTELEQLILDTMQTTGAPPPELMDQRGPTLVRDALFEDGFYLVGLIGGKDVGKSALVNALVGEPITQTTSFGPGTEAVIAYAHESAAGELKQLLERTVPGCYRVVTHRLARLSRQVLLDLPDIDSHWQSHVQITRTMLRHMLFPLWVQSVEKYADRQPQQLLAKVAEGNAAGNFIFCLNKADQLDAAAVEELREDFGRRIGRLLSIDPPRIWMLSAARPGEFDLPALVKLLSQQKENELVRESQQLAGQQQDRSMLGWLDRQDLPGRAARLARLQEEAEELLTARIGVPLLERSLPALADDPASRLALTDELLAARTHRWPIVNLVHAVLTPVLAVIRRNVGAVRTASLPDAEALVDAHLNTSGKPLGDLIRSVFAQLQQLHPQMSDLYQRRKLWEDLSADTVAAQLRSTLTETVAQQRDVIRRRLTGKSGVIFAPVRWLLTIGALLWFPFIQPITQTLLSNDITHSTHDIVLLAVRIFSVNELLQNLTFLTMYFFLLWIILRWDTQRRVARLASRWKSDASELSMTSQAMRWLDDLLQPIREARERAESLAMRADNLRKLPANAA
jgi:GTPase Era involved in 16S rRNA processing